MAQIAFILLSHKRPQDVVDLARGLVQAGDRVAIHYDGRAPAAEFAQLRAALGDRAGVTFAPRRLRCGWGEWSLVEATLEAARAALAAFPEASHLYMISGDCMAIKTAEYARSVLDAEDADFIESHDFFESDWIRTGLKAERLIYRHYVNERARKRLFYASLDLQKRLRLEREIPADLRVMIGSQWWCLRRATVERVLAFCAERPDIPRFFRTTWIPDETFFQTLVRHLVPAEEIRNRTLTFKLFTDYGMPATFYNDHYDLLLAQDALFARKISPEAADLRARLGALYAETGVPFRISNEGARVHRFLTQRGREGRRFAPRAWEAEASLGRDQTVHLLVCKKWHVARRLAARIREAGLMPALDYVFDEAGADLPDLGGIGRSLDKRQRHRRALVHLLFAQQGTDDLLVCLDPARLDTIRDLAASRATVRVLEVRCILDDTYLRGHAIRTGLAGAATPDEVMERLLPTVRGDIRHESDALAEAGLAEFHRVTEGADAAANALALARFLAISQADAAALLAGAPFAD